MILKIAVDENITQEKKTFFFKVLKIPQEKISNLKFSDHCISKYLQEHYTRCIMRAPLFLKNVPGTFFNTIHQVKAIAIGVSEANPLIKIS